MRTLNIAVMSLLFAIAVSGGGFAASQKANAPGQDRTCLITSKNGGFNDADVGNTQWLPRKAAEKQDSQDPNKRVFDYTNDPLVLNGTYASAEELCKNHFN